MFILSLVVALATQEPAPLTATEPVQQAPIRTVTQLEVGRLKDPVSQAKRACPWIQSKGAIQCYDDALERFNVVQSSAIDAPAGLEVRALLVPGGSCSQAQAVSISVRHPEKPITIDWQRTTLDVDGVARQPLPGFARAATAALAQRPSTAGAGALLAESVFVDGSKECVTELRETAKATAVRLSLAIKVGDDDTTTVITQALTWESMTEQQAIMLLPVPEALPQPDEPFPLAATGAATSAAVAVAGSVGVGVAVALQQPGAIGTGIGIGAVGSLVYGGLCGGAAYAALWWPGGEEARRKSYADALDEIAHREHLLRRQAEIAATP